jgi:hypothetical protein
MRSLQQRLEQLVAVHRQLLRRFASLELENEQMRKKILLRDERMSQLEGNSRALSSSLRLQAEKHAADLTGLRQQILELRAEHNQRLEHIKIEAALHHSGSAKGPKTLRGGGNKTHAAPTTAALAAALASSASSSDDTKAKPGFIARMLGQS